MEYFVDEDPVDLKEAIDIQDLQDPNKGVQFEVDTKEAGPEKDLTNAYFPGEKVFENILKLDDETAEICDKEGLDTFEVLQRNMEDITSFQDGGVFKQVTKHGAGPLVPYGALVRIHYNAYHEMEPEPFDSTRLRQQVEKFRVGIGNQVEGMHVAVSSMKKGERSRFLFKPEYFYGKMGCPPRIPPDCTVLFDIEVMSFVEREGVDDYHQMTEEERKQVTFEFVCKVSKSEREEGNQLFNSSMFHKALGRYKRAAKILEDYHLKNEREQKEQEKTLVKVYVNMALCCHKLKQNGITITYCHKALALQPNNVKALYHKAQALHFMSEFEQARGVYLKAQRLDSTNKAIASSLKRLDQDIKKFAIQSGDYKKMCQRMVSTSVSSSEPKTEEPSEAKQADDGEECSQRFRDTVREKLDEFQKNKDMVEMPFPEQSLTVPEIACIVGIADEFGMIVQRRGTGNASKMVLIKRKKDLEFDK